MAYNLLGAIHWSDTRFGWSKSPDESIARAEELVQKSLELDESYDIAHVILAAIYRFKRQWDKALAENERAVSLSQASYTIGQLAATHTYLGRSNEAIALFKKAIRFDPFSPTNFYQHFGMAYFGAEQYKDALTIFKQVLERAKKGKFNLVVAHLNLATTYAMLDQDEQAWVHVAELLNVDPNYTVKRFSKTVVYKNQVDTDRIINAIRKAGLPE